MDWTKEVVRLFGEANEQQARAGDLGNRLIEVRNRISTAAGAPPVAPGDFDELKVLTDRVAQAQSQSIALSGQALTLLNSHLPPKNS